MIKIQSTFLVSIHIINAIRLYEIAKYCGILYKGKKHLKELNNLNEEIHTNWVKTDGNQILSCTQKLTPILNWKLNV